MPLPHILLPAGRVWAGSDHHFLHARIIELSNRPFATAEEMSEEIVRRHNAVVGVNDVFIQTGDLCLGPFDQSIEYAARLNGIKFMVPGNHDRTSEAGRNKPAYIEKFRRRYEDAGFTLLPELGCTIDIDGVRFAVSHYPYDGDHTEQDRHTFFRPADEGHPLIHGHIHGQRRISGRMFNVGVDVNDFTPVSQEELLAFARAL